MYFSGDHLLERDRIELSRRVEEAISDADGRAFADWGSVESRFALQMRDIMNDMLLFLDRYEEEITDTVSNLNSEISSRDRQIEEDEEAFSEIKRLASKRGWD